MLAFLALIDGWPLLGSRLVRGYDVTTHLYRVVEFYEGLRFGELFPRWAPDFYGGFGAPVFNFYPPLFYYVAASFHALGASFIVAFNLAWFTFILLAGLGMYVLAAEFFGPPGGLVAAAALLFAPCFHTNLYVRGAAAAFGAVAFAFWGLYRFMLLGGYSRFLAGALPVALLVLSSTSIMLITLPALLALSIWLARLERDLRPIRRGTSCLLTGLGVSAFFWLPMVADYGYVHFERLPERNDFHDHFVLLEQLVSTSWGYGPSRPGVEADRSFAIGAAQLVLVGVALLVITRPQAASRLGASIVRFFLVLLAGTVFLSLPASVPIWEHVPPLSYLQFPWRFLSLGAVSAAFLSGAVPALLTRQRSYVLAASAVAILALVLPNLSHAQARAYSQRLNDQVVSAAWIAARSVLDTEAREFEPIWVQADEIPPIGEPLSVLTGQAQVLDLRLSPADREFQIDVSQTALLRLTTFYFPGWIVSVDGIERAIDYNNPLGAMELSLEPGLHNVKAAFGDTPIRFWSTRLSLLALAVLLAVPGLARLNRREVPGRLASLATGGYLLLIRTAGRSDGEKVRPEGN